MDDSHDIYVDCVDIYGDERFPNNDGFDPESCTNVRADSVTAKNIEYCLSLIHI